jgi:glyoxalase family protein
MQPIQGLHHITAMCRDAQRTVAFYHHLLGQRLVKKTVNFDDPGTYHLYFGDETGTPGTILTFFPWPHVKRGNIGNGETAAVAYAIAPGTVDFWCDRLVTGGVTPGAVHTRFDQQVIPFHDPDGMALELITSEAPATFRHWQAGPVAEEFALRGFHGVTLWLDQVEATAALLRDGLAYVPAGQEGNRYRYQAAAGDGSGIYVDLLHRPGQPRGKFGGGSIHHIAFRTLDDAEQLEYQQALRRMGQHVTPVQDRQYFRSIYFRSAGGVLFEIATDAPGFLYDEAQAELGTQLKLPPWLEPRRAEIEQHLPPVTIAEP